MTRALAVVIALGAGLGVGCGGGTTDPDAGATDARATGTDAPTTDDVGSSGDAGPVDPCAGGACDPCDDGLAIDGDAMGAARAMGMCSGVVSASWRLPDGAPAPTGAALGHGLLDGYGMLAPREGARMLALSTGTARAPDDVGHQSPAGFSRDYMAALPAGFPDESSRCSTSLTTEAYDAIMLEVVLDVPAGARGLRFLLKHHTFEWPSYVCSPYNDGFAVLMDPSPEGWALENVVLDADGDTLSVNSTLIDVCTCAGGPPCSAGGLSYACSAGASELAGTGYDTASAGAATRWLETRIPVVAGTRITLRFMLWDLGDSTLDSTTLLDGFRWTTDAPAFPETRVAP